MSDEIEPEIADSRIAAWLGRVKAIPADERARDERLVRLRESEEHYADVETRYRRKMAGLPEEYWPKLAAPMLTPAMTAVAQWLDRGDWALILGGDRGVGKSFACAWAVEKLGGRFVPAIDLVQAGAFDRPFWRSLEAVKLLAIDDLGAEPMDAKGWHEGSLAALITSRCGDGKRLLVATNLTGPQFRDRYGGATGRIYDRLKGSYAAVAGESMRERGHA